MRPCPRLPRPIAVLCALAALLVVSPHASAAPEFFGPDAVFNQRVDTRTQLDRDSSHYAAELRRQVEEYRATVNIRRYTVPIYRVGGQQPHVKVTIDREGTPRMQEIMSSVPVPEHAQPSEGTDGNLVVYQAATDTMWEFWRFSREADGFHAEWGGRVVGLDESPGWYRNLTDPLTGKAMEKWFFGANATHLNLLGGIMTLPELRSGRIDHALVMSIPEARAGVWSLPATETDGKIDDPRAIPEGAWFRLDPDLDLDSLSLPPMTRMMARAAQRYGIVVANTAQNVVFYGEDATRRSDDPYAALLDGARPIDIAAAFPWEHLQTLPLRLTDGTSEGDTLRAADRRGSKRSQKRPARKRQRTRG
ncbi:MAG: hypothetical protein ACEQSX_00685 [Baekduiaceae bacterium]